MKPGNPGVWHPSAAAVRPPWHSLFLQPADQAEMMVPGLPRSCRLWGWLWSVGWFWLRATSWNLENLSGLDFFAEGSQFFCIVTMRFWMTWAHNPLATCTNAEKFWCHCHLTFVWFLSIKCSHLCLRFWPGGTLCNHKKISGLDFFSQQLGYESGLITYFWAHNLMATNTNAEKSWCHHHLTLISQLSSAFDMHMPHQQDLTKNLGSLDRWCVCEPFFELWTISC